MATSMADLGFNIDSSPMRRASRELDRMSTASGRAERSADGLAGAYRAVGAAVAALGLAQLTRSVFDTVRSTEALQASLKTVTGSISEANAAWDTLEQFAKTTPFTLDQSVKGFIRMKSLGLDPTTDALESFGNTASAMGKDLMQMIEAVADASTGEFERLKEFGIRARTEGDNIRFIFQGMETVVDNSSTAITGYLESLGNTAFSGAMADQMDTVGGQVSNLEDQIDSLFRAIGDAGATDLFKESIAGASSAVEALTDNLDQVAAAAAGVTAATGAYLLFSNATAAATAAQVAFNAAARVNPYIFIASTIAGATAAVWAFTNAQSSATEVWERATESEAAYQAALADVGAANRIQQIVKERAELQERLVDAQSRWIRNGTEEEHIKQRLAELEAEYHQITDARIEAEKAANERREEARAREEEALKRQAEIERQQEAAKAAAAKAERDSTIEQVDLLRERLGLLKEGTVEFRKNVELVRKAVDAGVITKDQAAEIVRVMQEAGEEFENEWQSVADRVADSLQDAIASGDWDKLGEAIGNALATSIAGVVNKTITDNLAKDLTANSSTLAKIGGAFAGPIAGAVAGGAIQLAVSELSDFFSGSDWDPTEARQAAQGTGTLLGSIDEKSASIANAVDITATTNEQLVNINTGMLRALQNVQAGIQGAVAMTLRQNVGVGFRPSGNIDAGQFFGGAAPILGESIDLAADFFDEAINVFTLGVLDGFVGDALGSVFGGGQKVVDEGIRILGGNLSDLVNETLVQAYATIKEDGGWFGSDKRFDKFQSIATNQFALAFESIYESIEKGATALGLLPDDVQSRLDAFVVETTRISLEDLNAGEQQAEIEAVFSTIFDDIAGAVVPFLDRFQNAGEGLGETLARVASQVGVMNEAIIATGAAFDPTSPEQITAAADSLTTLFGGIEGFTQALTGYESNFLTDEQQLENLRRRLTGGLGDIDLPATRQAYADLVSAQNLAVQVDRERYATLLQLQGAADQYFKILEEGQKEAEDAAEAAKRAAEAFANSLKGLTDDAFRDLQQAVSRERALAQEEYDARITANRLALSAAQEGLQAIEQELQGIQRARSSLSGQYDPIAETLRQNALATLRGALASGDLTGVGVAADAAAQIEEANFQSRTDYLREQGRTLNLLAQLDESGSEQLTTAEQSVRALERQTRTIEWEFADEQARLDGILDAAQEQINAARGIETAVLSVSQAINALAAQLGVEQISPAEGFDQDAQRQDFIKSLYESIGRDIGSVTQSEISFWMAEGLGLSSEALRAEFLRSAAQYVGDPNYGQYGARAAQMLSVLPQFADGGMHSGGLRVVGERGPEIEMTGPSKIMSNAELMQSLGANRELLAEIRALRAENLAAQRKIEKNTRELKQIQERWNQTGLPETRDFA